VRKLLPTSLAGQLIAVLLLALIAAQIASMLILHDDRRLAFIFVARQEVMSRTASVVRLLNQTDPALHGTIVDAASSRRLRFSIDDKSAVDADDDDEGVYRFLKRRLAWELSDTVGEVRVAISEIDDDDDDDEPGKDKDDDNDDGHMSGRGFDWMHGDQRWFREWRSSRHSMRRFMHEPRRLNSGMTIAIETKTGGPHGWLNVYSLAPATGPSIAIPSLVTIVIMAILLVVIVIVMVRRVTRPLARLSHSAERFGRGEDIGLLPETGPEDIRKASRAFNDMQQRLSRFVQDRTRMLAAITHDLRTPITALRIRAEMIEDAETRAKILETLAEMQSLTDAALDFARQESVDEKTRSVDLTALVDSLCADMADLGQPVEYTTPDQARLPYACHPDALKRVLRNLIDNAVRYGQRARVGVTVDESDICIHIEDDGPGIPAEMRARIFDPFVRLEESRSQETGGIGLGLAIARTIAHAHGGDIEVADSDAGGAVFTVRLPRQS